MTQAWVLLGTRVHAKQEHMVWQGQFVCAKRTNSANSYASVTRLFMTNQSTPQSPLPIGSIISDKYRIERIVGKGGMGIVFAARHIKLDEPVAIKLMLSDDLCNRESVERFLREARACAKLKNNEHVARVTDVDTLPNGLPYMVMELLDGQDLDKILKESGVFAIHDACSYLIQACKALAEAHKFGIIHRDLKPQNLFLARRQDGSPCIKVLDFGISKHTLTDESASIDLTRPSDILGSAYYMSPEQARSSRSVVPQSDIYSLGAVLYKLLTGRAPFPRKTLLDVYKALLDEPPAPPSQFRAEIPPALESLILRCLDKTVSHRFSSANELMSALAPFTVPGETTKVDDTDSDSVTTLPRGRAPKLSSLNGTMLLEVGNHYGRPDQHRTSGQTHSDKDKPDLRGVQFKTQPLDAKSLHAALHGYLPPRTTTRPAAPSQPQIQVNRDVSADGPTPRITHRTPAIPAPLREEPAPKPRMQHVAAASPTNGSAMTPTAMKVPMSLPVNSPQSGDTVYVPSLAHIMTQPALSPSEHLPLNTTNNTMTPWNAFPAVAGASRRQSKWLLLASGIILVVLVLLFWKLLT
jgi:serine/threonine protein kinase